MSSLPRTPRPPADAVPPSGMARRRPAAGSDSLYFRTVRPCLLGAVLLAACVPAACVALAIAIGNWITFGDRSRILFAQDRVGRQGKTFRMWKFRSMWDADEPHFESWADGSDEDRVTPFGSLLRRTHLDELPQLWNVLRGEMSLIGPRPEMLEVHRWAAANVPGFDGRLRVRPGLTGLAQLRSGYASQDVESYRSKLDHDLEYIDGASLRGDLAILIGTPLAMLARRGWQSRSPEGEALRELQPTRLDGHPRRLEGARPALPSARLTAERPHESVV